jgi:asparagine synthase (glutamine-hydrolysing)
VREQFFASVKQQTISDVPVGALLSSGLDSSSIVATMARSANHSLHTYTITFPEQYRVGEVTLDDPAVAARFARQAGCIHQEIVVEPGSASLLPKLVWHMDDPVADPAIVTAFLVCRAARESVTVLLSGIGGDELFAGYRKHTAHYWSQAYRRLPGQLRTRLIEPTITGLPSLRGTRFKGYVRLLKKMSRSGSLSPQDEFMMNSTYLDTVQKDVLYSEEMRCRLDGFDPWLRHRDAFARVASSDFLNQMLYVDSKVFMPGLNLNYGDKMSMASSVELRVPFLDRGLAAWAAWDVPPHFKLAGPARNKTKYIFRKAMQGLVPDEVLRQRKAGFGAPVDYWLAHDLKEMVDDLLSEDRIKRRGYFESTAIRDLIREQRSGRQDWSMQIWQLLTLELWMQAFIDAPQHSIVQNRE